MATSPLRYRRLANLLPKYNYAIKPAAIEAGFSPKTADKQGKRLLNNTLKQQAKDILATVEGKVISTNDAKRFMSDIVGLSGEQVMQSLKNIATNTRDYASALKVLTPLAKEHGVQIASDDAPKVNVPILNVTLSEKDTKVIGLVEPPITQPIQELSSI